MKVQQRAARHGLRGTSNQLHKVAKVTMARSYNEKKKDIPLVEGQETSW